MRCANPRSRLRDRTPLEATDHLGVINRLWLVTDPGVQTPFRAS